MNSTTLFSTAFIVVLVAGLILRFWLATRHVRHVMQHRETVPTPFAKKVALETHQKIADYTVTKVKSDLILLLLNTTLLIGFTLLGGLQWLSTTILHISGAGMVHQMGLLLVFAGISAAIGLPFAYYQQFVLEPKLGLNTNNTNNPITRQQFFTDIIKGMLLGLVIGLPLLWVVLRLMEITGNGWWVCAWLIWSGFQLFKLYPNFAAPLLNKLIPLKDKRLQTRINDLMQRTNFVSKDLMVMQNANPNPYTHAYFPGSGTNRYTVLFDTLLAQLTPKETEAVLAHAIGHVKLKHLAKRIAMMLVSSFAFFAILGFLKNQAWFYSGLGMDSALAEQFIANQHAIALILFMLAVPIFTFPLSPLTSYLSRSHTLAADAFAIQHILPRDLTAALVKIHENFAITLTPDPLYCAFYDMYPPVMMRIDKLQPKQ